MAGFIVGAYAAAFFSDFDSEYEGSLLRKVLLLKNTLGFEIPIHSHGKLHRFDEDWFLELLKTSSDGKKCSHIVTCIPGIMETLSSDPHFGIASANEIGRQKALFFLQQVRNDVERLSHITNVLAVQIQSAPTVNPEKQALSSQEALIQSLKEILSWDWSGAHVVIEHCDAYDPSHECSKGFLSLEDEIEALKRIKSLPDDQRPKTPTGICINWGRSAFEHRSAEGPLIHLRRLQKEEELLKGLMFSGVVEKADANYPAWKDSHSPFAPSSDTKKLNSSNSLMTLEEATKCFKIAGKGLLYQGVKIAPQGKNLTVEEKLAYIEDGLNILKTAQSN
eukprot:TRINITY_DN1124_c0_g2_i2.p1 TRINITY_DN1124_c0_g2~~TRINITY_DN1124_c0_g2_i2.p1  ORF type:complete len:335 (+),score=65.62 TRINITY_DN1124_c0_g2_i2:104-1108(+)